MFFTSSGVGANDIKQLRSKLFEVCKKMLENQRQVPIKWLKFEAVLTNKLVAEKLNYISIEDARKAAKKCNVKDVDDALRFMHNRSVVVHHRGSSIVVLNPQWCMNLFTKVISIPDEDVPRDALHRKLVKEGILMQEYLDKECHGKLLQELLVQSGLICRWKYERKDAYIVPSVIPLMEEGDDVEKKITESVIAPVFLNFKLGYVLPGLFTRFLVKVIDKCREFLRIQAPRLFRNYTFLSFKHNESEFDVYFMQQSAAFKIGVVPSGSVSEQCRKSFAKYLKQVMLDCIESIKEDEELFYRNVEVLLTEKCTECFGEANPCSNHGVKDCIRDECGHFWTLEDFVRLTVDCACDYVYTHTQYFLLERVKPWICPDKNNDSERGTEEKISSAGPALPSGTESTHDVLSRCKLFEDTLVNYFEEKLEKYGKLVKAPGIGRKTAAVAKAGQVLSCGIAITAGATVALTIATAGATAFAAGAVTGTVIVANELYKYFRRRKAKEITEVTKKEVSSILVAIVHEAGKELSRIYEYQLAMLKDDTMVEVLAKSAVDAMLDPKKKDTFDANALVNKVMTKSSDKKKLETREGKQWKISSIFKKPGLRKVEEDHDGLCKTYHYSYWRQERGVRKKRCRVEKYGYRAEVLKIRDQEHSEIRVGGEDSRPTACGQTQHFEESEIDQKFKVKINETPKYRPSHCLLISPADLQQCAYAHSSLAKFVAKMYKLDENQVVNPVYRPRELGRKVLNLSNTDLRGSDFTRADFSNCQLEKCDFSKCTVLFGRFDETNLGGAKFTQSYLSNCFMEAVDARNCKWTLVKVLYCEVRRGRFDVGVNNLGGNDWTGTNLDEINEEVSDSAVDSQTVKSLPQEVTAKEEVSNAAVESKEIECLSQKLAAKDEDLEPPILHSEPLDKKNVLEMPGKRQSKLSLEFQDFRKRRLSETVSDQQLSDVSMDSDDFEIDKGNKAQSCQLADDQEHLASATAAKLLIHGDDISDGVGDDRDGKNGGCYSSDNVNDLDRSICGGGNGDDVCGVAAGAVSCSDGNENQQKDRSKKTNPALEDDVFSERVITVQAGTEKTEATGREDMPLETEILKTSEADSSSNSLFQNSVVDEQHEEADAPVAMEQEDLEWFRNNCLDEDYNFKDDHQKSLRSLPWVKSFGIAGPNDHCKSVHLFIVHGYNDDPVIGDLQRTFGDEIVHYVELEKGKQRPRFDFLVNDNDSSDNYNNQSVTSYPSPGNGIYILGDDPKNYGSLGTFAFNYKNDHYVTTCYHCCYKGSLPEKTHEVFRRLKNDAKNKNSATRTSQYCFRTRREQQEEPKNLGKFSNGIFDENHDFALVKVIPNCTHGLVNELSTNELLSPSQVMQMLATNGDIEVEKRGHKTGLTRGVLKSCMYNSTTLDFFKNSYFIKDDNSGKPFVEKGDSGSLIALTFPKKTNKFGKDVLHVEKKHPKDDSSSQEAQKCSEDEQKCPEDDSDSQVTQKCPGNGTVSEAAPESPMNGGKHVFGYVVAIDENAKGYICFDLSSSLEKLKDDITLICCLKSCANNS